MPRRSRRRVSARRSPDHKLIWLSVFDEQTFEMQALAGSRFCDDAVLLSIDDWRIVNAPANEKCVLLRTIIHEHSVIFWPDDPGATTTSAATIIRVLRTADEEEISPLPSLTFGATFLDKEDVLYNDQVPWSAWFPGTPGDFREFNAAPTPMIDCRVKRKLEANVGLRYTRFFSSGITDADVQLNSSILARMLIKVV